MIRTALTLLNVIGEIDSLQVLISLAVELTVSLEVGLVAAQPARVVVVVDDDDELLREAESRSVFVDVVVQLLEVVGVEV